MTEVLFYHLERASLDDVLPGMLEKVLGKGWRAQVFVGSGERASALDSHLWTFRDDSFLPHALQADRAASDSPIVISHAADRLHDVHVSIFADGRVPESWGLDATSGVARLVLLFDGRNAAELESARLQWKQARAAGHDVTYWQQSAEGRWEKRS